MTTHVIMNVDRPNGFGGTYKVGVEYDLPDDLAALWRGQGVCRQTSVRSEQTGTVISATSGNFPGTPAHSLQIPAELMNTGKRSEKSVLRAVGLGVIVMEYGGDPTGVVDSSSAIDSYIADCVSSGADIYIDDFATFLISRPIILPPGIGIAFGKKAWLKVAPSFVGLAVLTDNNVTYTSETGIKDANIDLNGVPGVGGIRLGASKAVRITSPRIVRAAGHGIFIGPSGYQVKIRDPEIFGSSPRALYGGTQLTVPNPGQIIFTATATNGSNQLTAASSTDGLYVGMLLYASANGATMITTGVTITAIAGSTITMSAPYTGTTATLTLSAVDLNVPRGIVLRTSDCSIHGGAVQHLPVGYEDMGGNSRAVDLHCWSTYHSNDNPMFFNFVVRGQGSRLIGCFADSPRTFDNTASPTQANAGIGFNIADGGDGINSRLIGCKLFISQYGDALPANNSVLPVYSGKLGFAVPDFDVIDAANTVGYGSKIIVAPWVRFFNAYVASLATIGQGGNLYQSGAVSIDAGTQNKQNGLIAGSRMAGAVALVGSTTSAGLTTSDSQANAKNIAGSISFIVHIKMTAKGSLAGTLSITGLPFYAPNYLGDLLFPVLVKNATLTAPVFAKIGQNSNTAYLVDGLNNAISAGVLNDNTEISIAGAFAGTWS